MENLSSRNDVEGYISQLSDLNEEIGALKNKWKEFYFGWVTPFHVCDVSKEDFFFFASLFPKSEVLVRENLLMLKIGQENTAGVYLHTEVDFELYEKYILKKVTAV